MAEPLPPLAEVVPSTPRDRFEQAVREAATYRSQDLGGEGTCGWLLSESQFAAIMAAFDRELAAGIEAHARTPASQRPPRHPRAAS